jgi:hypothetical protein
MGAATKMFQIYDFLQHHFRLFYENETRLDVLVRNFLT